MSYRTGRRTVIEAARPMIRGGVACRTCGWQGAVVDLVDSGYGLGMCRFGDGNEAVARVELKDGCLCFPQDRKQALCLQHLSRATPAGEMIVVDSVWGIADGAGPSAEELMSKERMV